MSTLDRNAVNTVDSFGGKSTWGTLQENAMGSTDYREMGLASSADQDTEVNTALSSKFSKGMESLEDSINRMSEANASLLKGEIPADVSAAVRRAAAESSVTGGIFGSSSRNLSARDLGRTSLSIQQAGMENEQQIAESKRTAAGAYEQVRQWNKTYDASLRELQIKQQEQNMSAIEIESDRAKFNASQNLRLLEIVANLVSNQQQVAAQLSISDVDPSGSIATFNSLIDSMTGMISGA